MFDRTGGDPDNRFSSAQSSSPFSGFSQSAGASRGGPMFEEEISPEEMFRQFFGGGGMGGGFGGPFGTSPTFPIHTLILANTTFRRRPLRHWPRLRLQPRRRPRRARPPVRRRPSPPPPAQSRARPQRAAPFTSLRDPVPPPHHPHLHLSPPLFLLQRHVRLLVPLRPVLPLRRPRRAPHAQTRQ